MAPKVVTPSQTPKKKVVEPSAPKEIAFEESENASSESSCLGTVFGAIYRVVSFCVWSTLLAAVVGFSVYTYKTGTTDLWYRWSTTVKAFFAVISLKETEVKAFINSYEIFEAERITPEMESKIVDYYNVINHLCALGEVEKMYIPPFVDHDQGCYGNQLEFERQMVDQLGVKKGDKVLELGCGRGRILNHVARYGEANGVGLNIDAGQIAEAKSYAESSGMADRLSFVQASFNDYPLPFEDNEFDHFYHVQAFTYVTDLEKMMSELWRVLKPGARVSFLDWFVLDGYDETNAEHRELLRKTKALIGAVYTPHPSVYEVALAKQGFKLIKSEEGSIAGHQFPLIEAARDFFMPVGTAVNWLSEYGILPEDTATLLNRLNLYVDDFIESDRLRLFTTSWHIIAEKPLEACQAE